jgi:Kef-type K+ transport system membrane component KefB
VLLVQALVVVALPVAALRLSRLKGLMPLVVAQIVIGIALGPSLLGRVAPDVYRLFFNPASLAPLAGIASVAVLFFGFVSGVHLDPGVFRGKGRAFAAMAAASVAIPTLLGSLVGLWIAARYPTELGPGIGRGAFAAAIGICTGVTALPVLAAILYEMNLMGQRLGSLALAAAGFNDAALWILLGLLLTAVAGAGAQGPGPLVTLALLPLYLAAMVWVVRPLVERLVVARMAKGELYEGGLALVCAVAIASALITESLGLHYILGAFVAGAVMPGPLRRPLLDRLQAMTVGLLMPFFFMLTGLRTLIDFGSAAFVEVLAAATAVAVLGKLGGTALAARLVGESWPMAFALGALLQTKGLMEVIVLTILRDAGIVSAPVFSALIVMAVVSTALAMPLTRAMLARESKHGVAELPVPAAGRPP